MRWQTNKSRNDANAPSNEWLFLYAISWNIAVFQRGLAALPPGAKGCSMVKELKSPRALPLVGWLCWGLTSQSTIFQSCRDGAIASWVINQYFRGVKCLAQGRKTAAVGLEPRTSRSGVRHSTTEPPRSPLSIAVKNRLPLREIECS